MFGVEVFGWTPVFQAETKIFRLEGSAYAHLDKEVVDRPIGVRFTKSAIDGLGYLTNAPQDADLTQIPRITTNPFGGLALQYPSGINQSLLSATQAEQIVEAKEIALEDKYGYGPYWIDEITTFGCADPTATNYESDIDFHSGDYMCGYGCDDENMNTDWVGNCTICKEGFEFIQASQVKKGKCVAIESPDDTNTDENAIIPQTDDVTKIEPVKTNNMVPIIGGLAVLGIVGTLMMKKS